MNLPDLDEIIDRLAAEQPPPPPLVRGWMDCQCVNEDGTIAWEEHVPNMVSTAGFNYLLDAGFHSGTQVTAWYQGLIANGTITLAAADTMGSHSGWTEFTSYSESTRQQWTVGAASGGANTNSTAVTFTINATGSQVYGFFITSVNTKSGTTGTLWCTGAFSQVRYPVTGQAMKFTYTITGASS